MASVEEDFPRGGTVKKAIESKPVTQNTEVDNLFEQHESDNKKRKGTAKDDSKKFKKQKTGGQKDDALTLNAAPKCVEILHVKNLREGMLLLGCVKEVTDFEVTVSLPCGLRGYISVRNISSSYTKLLSEQLDGTDTEDIYSLPHIFTPGMVLRCVLAKLDTTKGGSVSIQLSINPKLVNKGLTSGSLKSGMVLSGSVESVEDHGYIIDIGVSGTKAFLPKQAVKDRHNNTEELRVCQYVTSRLEEVKNEGRVVRLSVNPTTLAPACAETQHGWTLTNLLPGLLVKAQIRKVTTHGLILDFLSSFKGQVDVLHMQPEKVSSYAVGDELQARVLYVEPASRLVGLSLRSFLLPPGMSVETVPAAGERIGQVFEGCKMTAMHHMSGAMLELPDKTVVFVHRNHLKESHVPANDNKLLAMPEHTCRVLEFSPMDHIHFVSLRKSKINEPFFSYHDLKTGQVIEGTVSALVTSGMTVNVSDQIKGFVPRTHLSDILLKNPEKKYSEGLRVKCRVLSVDPNKKTLTLTRKKALVESTLPLFLTYSDARCGCVSHGYIVCVKDFGCIVRFYNDVKGLVPTKELSSEPVLNPEEMFYLGQVVKVKVLQCDPQTEKMLLSFRDVAEVDTEALPPPQFEVEVGQKLEVKVVKKSVNGLEVAILPGENRAALPTMHLSDHVSSCPLLWEALQEGDTISNLVCLNKSKQSITLTKKPTVMRSLEEEVVAKDFADITVGMQLIGWIKNIMPYGVFVEFPYGLVGLAPKSAMSDRFVSDVNTAYQMGQTVMAKVTNLDQEKKRFLVTLKESELITPEGDAQARLIRGLLERRAVADMMSSRDGGDLPQQLSALRVGEKRKLTVEEVTENDGAIFKSDQLVGATILASKQHIVGVNLTPGQKVTAVVLHVDLLSSHVNVSVIPSLLQKQKSLSEGSKYNAVVQHVDKDFAVISLGNVARLTVIQTTSHLNQVHFSDSTRLCQGKRLTVVVTDPSCEDLEGLPLVSWEVTAQNRQRTISDSQAKMKGYLYGDFVKGTVRTIKPTCVLVRLEDGSTGSVHVSEVTDGACLGTFPTSSVKVGMEITARVIGGREASSHRFLPFSHPKFRYYIAELTLVPSKLDDSVELKQVTMKEKMSSYKVGDEITCFVSKYIPQKKVLELAIDPCITGTVEMLSFIRDPKDVTHPEKLFKLGQTVKATVVEVTTSKPQRFCLSLNGVHKLAIGDVTLGIVTGTQPHLGLQVKLPCGATGTVATVDLADAYRPNPLQAYSKEQVLRFFIVGKENDKWQLSLRQSRLNPDQAKVVKDPEVISLEQLQPGQVIRGYVKSAGEQGVFIRLSRSIMGRAQLHHATKYFVKNNKVFTENLPVNTLLTSKILSINKEASLVDLSLLSEDTGKQDVLPESLKLPLRLIGEEKVQHDTEKKRKRLPSESHQDQAEQVPKKKKKAKKGKTEERDSIVEVYFREEEDEKEDKPKAKPVKVKPSVAAPARLQVSGGFSWDVGLSSLKPASTAQEAESSDEEDQEEKSKTKKKSRQELELEKKQAEQALVQQEMELMDPNLRPKDASGFERLLLASPDSSVLWLQYMAHHLEATQIEQARAVAERAIKTISFREEQEKLNVWVALMNLENMYGTDESLKKVFQRALQFCEPMPIYQQMADIYTNSTKTKEAEGLYKTMVKRFRENKAVWLSYGAFLLKQGNGDAANALLQRALKSLPTRESVDLIGKFAQLEFRYGDPEKGQSMMNMVLTNYPKRTDLWSVFIDLTVKYRSQEEVRALFDRMIHLSVAVKKIKFFFKRYLEYEKKYGTPESIQSVKEKALEYVEAQGTQAAC